MVRSHTQIYVSQMSTTAAMPWLQPSLVVYIKLCIWEEIFVQNVEQKIQFLSPFKRENPAVQLKKKKKAESHS